MINRSAAVLAKTRHDLKRVLNLSEFFPKSKAEGE